MENYARILSVFLGVGTIHSRIKIQKILYVLKSLGYPISEKYQYRHFGPYSEQLASELATSVNSGFLDESEESLASGSIDDFSDYQRYDLTLTERGRRFLQSCLKKNPNLRTQSEAITELCKQLNKYSPTELELIATLMYLQDQKTPENQLAVMLKNLKPKFEMAEATKALQLIDDLRSTSKPGVGSLRQ
jgi:uncharacterized protein YwgA